MNTPMDMLTAMDARQRAFQDQWQAEIERTREQERLRTVKYMRYAVPPSSFATPASTFTLNAQDVVQSGYVWDLRIVSGKLSVSDSVALYIGENNNGQLIGYVTPGTAPTQLVFVILIPKSSALWNAGETLFLQTSGAGNITSLRLCGWQAAAEMAGKLF